jgi:MFS family permease
VPPPPRSSEPLFTPRFFVMCGFTFTVFLSAFMLMPTAPFRILDLGGREAEAGLFLGLLTYASAFSAPITGALADRIGKRRMLIVGGTALTGFAIAYGFTTGYRLLLLLAFFHGLFWSGLLSASSAYMTDVLPESRRAEGLSYWGLSTIAAIAVAPSMGLWLYHHGWIWLCAAMAALNGLMTLIAFQLDEPHARARLGEERFFTWRLVEWRVLITSGSLFLYSWGYGGITSFVALYAESRGVEPKGLYFPVLAGTVAVSRIGFGSLPDRLGPRRVFVPCQALMMAGLVLLALGGTRPLLIGSAVLFGLGLGTAQPAYVSLVMSRVDARRRGAAFGSLLAAFDVGIGTGSIATGWLVGHFGYGTAYGLAAGLASLSIPWFLLAERRFLSD